MPSLETLVELAKPWAKFYSKSHATQSVVMFAHIAGMLGGGGLAIAADRAMWKARAASHDARAKLLAEVDRTHRPVLMGLVLVVISGLLMATADIETYGPSLIFWGKMVLFALLIANGAWLQRLERGMQRSPASMDASWARITLSSRFSYVLWFAVALGGVLLNNA